MASTIQEPAHVALAATEGDVVAELASGEVERVFLLIVNVDTASRTFSLHRYKSGSGGGESKADTNAIFKDRKIPPSGDEVIELSVTLTEGWKLTGLADVADKVIVHVNTVSN